MIEKLKNLGWKQFGGLVLIVIIIIAFGFGGFGGGFSTNNQNNIAKINKTNVTTQDFIDYVNQSGISQEAIRDNLDNNIIEELLSGLISTTLIDLEIEDFDLSINERTILKNIKENKNFHDENGTFQSQGSYQLGIPNSICCLGKRSFEIGGEPGGSKIKPEPHKCLALCSPCSPPP